MGATGVTNLRLPERGLVADFMRMICPHTFAAELPRAEGVRIHCEDGRPLDVFNSNKGLFTAFDLSGPARLVLERQEGWEGAQIKPASAGVQSRIEGKRLVLTLRQPVPLLIEGPGKQLISLLAKAPAGEPPAPQGGGRLLRFAAGKVHHTADLELRNHDVIWLDAGAWVRGQIFASEVAGLVVGGRGVLENPPPEAGAPSYRAMLLDHCSDVQLSGIHMLTTRGWMITLGGCRSVRIDGVSQCGGGAGTDGIDIVGSRDVQIRRCFLLNGDDNIAIKAMDLRTQVSPCPTPGKRFNGDWTGEVADVLVEDCAFYNDHGGSAMEIGFETRTDHIRDITFRNIDVMAVHSFGSVFGIHIGDRATVENVLWEDIHVEHHYDKLVDFRILNSRWNLDAQRGCARNITLRRIRVQQSIYNPGYTISVIGGWDAQHTIRDVLFEDFYLGDTKILDADSMDLYLKRGDGLRFG